jgi:hypothetical protein
MYVQYLWKYGFAKYSDNLYHLVFPGNYSYFVL